MWLGASPIKRPINEMQHKNKYNVDLEERGLVLKEKANNNRSVIPEKRTNASNINME